MKIALGALSMKKSGSISNSFAYLEWSDSSSQSLLRWSLCEVDLGCYDSTAPESYSCYFED